MPLLHHRLYIITGKGGVGKTTLAMALTKHLQNANYNVKYNCFHQNPEKILAALQKLYVVPRSFTPADYLKQEKEVLKLNPNLEVHYMADHPYKNISSTNLRK